jgi:AraC-like DNA-binding protein
MNTPCYSARFVRPFAQLLAEYDRYPSKSLEALNAIDADSRIPMQAAHRLAVEQVEQTGDPDIGLKAARLMPFGRLGALTYATHTAGTLKEAIEVAARYARFFCDGAIVDLQVQDKRAILRLGSTVAPPRAITDFSISTWYLNRGYPAAGREAGFECWFSSPKPPNTTEYDRTFTQAGLRFAAPFDGFVFSRELLDLALPSADSTLHLLLRQQLDLSMAHLSRRTFASAVRDIITREMVHTTPTAATVARQLRMSARTLNRRLGSEGVTFGAIMDQLRHELALRYIGTRDMSLREVSSRLGFSHPESFHRAFKRWTGQTPLEYKRERRL